MPVFLAMRAEERAKIRAEFERRRRDAGATPARRRRDTGAIWWPRKKMPGVSCDARGGALRIVPVVSITIQRVIRAHRKTHRLGHHSSPPTPRTVLRQLHQTVQSAHRKRRRRESLLRSKDSSYGTSWLNRVTALHKPAQQIRL